MTKLKNAGLRAPRKMSLGSGLHSQKRIRAPVSKMIGLRAPGTPPPPPPPLEPWYFIPVLKTRMNKFRGETHPGMKPVPGWVHLCKQALSLFKVTPKITVPNIKPNSTYPLWWANTIVQFLLLAARRFIVIIQRKAVKVTVSRCMTDFSFFSSWSSHRPWRRQRRKTPAGSVFHVWPHQTAQLVATPSYLNAVVCRIAMAVKLPVAR